METRGNAGREMFVGKAEHTINRDGRISIPSKMRDVIKRKYDAEDLYLILMPGNIICLYPGVEFEKFIGKLDNANGAPLAELMEMERVCADAEICKIDGSGRIVIPATMREDAGIGQEVVVVGARTRIEIWNPDRWTWNREQSRSGMERLRSWPGAQTSIRS
jgi:MraZ protein